MYILIFKSVVLITPVFKNNYNEKIEIENFEKKSVNYVNYDSVNYIKRIT